MTCICQQDSWYPCHWPAVHIAPHFFINTLARLSKRVGQEQKLWLGRESQIQVATPWPAKRSWLQERDWQTETGRQSNLSASVSVSQFLFFQPAFLPATTWQPHEQISSHSMRWRSRDGCTQNMSGPKTSMNHETYGGCWWSKVWRPMGVQWVAVKHCTFFSKHVGY